MKKLGMIAVAALVVLAGLASAQGPQATRPPRQQPPNPPTASDANYARLSFLSGKAFLQRAADLGSEEAAVNMPVAEGDRLGTTDGRAEIYLAKKTYVRLDDNTKIDFTILPKKENPLIRLRQWAGHIYLDVAQLEKEKAIEILTSDATFYVLDKGLYRIDVRENADTEILVFQGLVEASGEEGSILVKKEQRLTIAGGRFEGRPAGFFASAEDGFDRWNEDRTAIVHRTYARRYLPEELEDFEGELEESGDWAYTDEFGYVWVPNGVDAGWRPYSYGRWTWMSPSWCWLPYEPWGWATSHYGYWHWGSRFGWYWIPYHVWGPAWVNWWGDPWYYGWAPMSWWGYPGVLVNNVYYGRGWNGDYPYNSRALTVVRKDQLQAPDIRKAALGSEALRSVGKISLNQTALSAKPAVKPGLKAEPLGGDGRVILRKSGEIGPASPSPTGRGLTPSPSRIVRPGSAPASPTTARPSPGTAPGAGRNIRREGVTSGFPSSSAITRQGALQGGRAIRPGTSLNRSSRYFNSGPNGPRLSPSRAPSSGSRSGGYSTPSRSASRGSSSSPSRGGSSGGSRSAGGSSGGSVRKK
jgi:hypothetical protein